MVVTMTKMKHARGDRTFNEKADANITAARAIQLHLDIQSKPRLSAMPKARQSASHVAPAIWFEDLPSKDKPEDGPEGAFMAT